MKRLVYDAVVSRRVAALEAEYARLPDLDRFVELILNGQPLPLHARDHDLKGKLLGFRSCGVGYTTLDERNVVMVYRVAPKKVYIVSVDEHDASYLSAIEVRRR